MSNDKIEKGRHLLKVPLEALHSLALQQIGEQESYIEELESKLKSLTEPVTHRSTSLLIIQIGRDDGNKRQKN